MSDDLRMEEEAYWNAAASERPGPLRRRRQMKWVREFEAKYGPSERLRRLIGINHLRSGPSDNAVMERPPIPPSDVADIHRALASFYIRFHVQATRIVVSRKRWPLKAEPSRFLNYPISLSDSLDADSFELVEPNDAQTRGTYRFTETSS